MSDSPEKQEIVFTESHSRTAIVTMELAEIERMVLKHLQENYKFEPRLPKRKFGFKFNRYNKEGEEPSLTSLEVHITEEWM